MTQFVSCGIIVSQRDTICIIRNEVIPLRDWLKKARTDAGMSQQEVANNLNLTRQYYALIETGKRQKSLDILLAKKISNLFGISLEQIAEYDVILE